MQFPAAADTLAHGTGGSMHIAPAGSVRKTREFTVMGMLVLVVMAGDGLQVPEVGLKRMAVSDSAWIIVASMP